jgi:hypothetical protein
LVLKQSAGLAVSVATCRHLVKDRMDSTGACWSLPGAEAILTLRVMITNGDFDTLLHPPPPPRTPTVPQPLPPRPHPCSMIN